MRHRRSHENQAEGIPGDVLVTAMASRLADLQDSKAQDEASYISSPKSNDDAGRRALIAGSVFSFLERQIERGDTGYVSLNKVFSQLEGVIPNLVIEELRFVVRFLDVSRMLRYQNITDDAIEERSIREWSRLLMYQAKLDRIKLTSAGRLWLRVLKHREHWLFEDKEVEKLHIAITQGIFEQVPIISSEIITSIRLFNEHLTEILESPSFRELVKQYLARRDHFSGMVERCHDAAMAAINELVSPSTKQKHENWLISVGDSGYTLSQLHEYVSRVHRATESLRRNWVKVLSAISESKRQRVGVVNFSLALDKYLEQPPPIEIDTYFLDGLSGWGKPDDFGSVLDVIGCMPEGIEPEKIEEQEFDLGEDQSRAWMRSWISQNRAALLTFLADGTPKNLIDIIQSDQFTSLNIENVGAVFGLYVVTDPLGGKNSVIIELRSGTSSVSFQDHNIISSQVSIRLAKGGQ